MHCYSDKFNIGQLFVERNVRENKLKGQLDERQVVYSCL